MRFLFYPAINLLLFILNQSVCGENGSNGTKFIRELIPLQAPNNLTLLSFDDRDAIISWNPVPPESVRGTFRGYIVRIWNHGVSQVYAIPPEVTRTAVQFFPYSKNFITVSVRNDKYVGPRSEAIHFDAPQTEPGTPFLFEQHQLGSHSALLQWNKPGNPNGILLGYNIYCSEAMDFGINEKTTIHEFILGPENTQAKLTGLKLGQRYQIEIAAVNCAGEGEHNTIFVEVEPHQPYPPDMPSFQYKINNEIPEKSDYFYRECTKPRYPYFPPHSQIQIDHMDDNFYIFNHSKVNVPTPPQDIKQITAEDPCLVNTLVKWIPDVDRNPGEYFFVKYRIKGNTEWIETLPERSEDFVILKNFNACRSYEIVLVAIDGDFQTESQIQETPAVLFLRS